MTSGTEHAEDLQAANQAARTIRDALVILHSIYLPFLGLSSVEHCCPLFSRWLIDHFTAKALGQSGRAMGNFTINSAPL